VLEIAALLQVGFCAVDFVRLQMCCNVRWVVRGFALNVLELSVSRMVVLGLRTTLKYTKLSPTTFANPRTLAVIGERMDSRNWPKEISHQAFTGPASPTYLEMIAVTVKPCCSGATVPGKLKMKQRQKIYLISLMLTCFFLIAKVCSTPIFNA
jgi:hypothetical protein